MSIEKHGLIRAFEKAGGPAALAKKLGFDRSTVDKWLRRGRIPYEHRPAVARAAGVPIETLAPTFFERD